MAEQTPAALGSGRPAGWVSFGVHSTLDYCHYTGALEFSEEKNASGMPKWERHDGCRWMPEPAAATDASNYPSRAWPNEGDPLWIWRGVKGDATTMYPAVVTERPSVLGGTLGVRVKWWNYDQTLRTDFIALTHIEARREPFISTVPEPVVRCADCGEELAPLHVCTQSKASGTAGDERV